MLVLERPSSTISMLVDAAGDGTLEVAALLVPNGEKSRETKAPRKDQR